MNRQFILLTIVLVPFVHGSPDHSKNAYGYQGGNSGGGYGTGQHYEQQSNTNAFNSESAYQQGQYSGHLGSGSGHLSSGSGHLGSHSGHLNGGGFSNGGLGNSGFGHGIHNGHSQGGWNQGGLGQEGFGQGGFSQGGLGQGGFGQGGLNHGNLQHQQNFRSADEIDGSSISIATNLPKNNEAFVFENQPISGDWSSIQSQAGISEAGLSGGLRDEASLLPPTTWDAVSNRNYRKISSSAILPISFSNEQESRNISEQQLSPNGSTTDRELRN